MAPPHGGFRAWFARRRPRWSIRATLFSALGIVFLVATVTMFVVHRPLWLELELVTAILSLAVFAFIAHTLYHGARFDKHERYEVPLFPLRYDGLPDFDVPVSGIGDLLLFGDGCLEALMGTAVSIVLVIGFVVVLWLGLNALITTIGILSIPLFFIFRWSLRRIVAAGRSCRARLGRSLAVGAKMTAAYMVWFYALIFAAHKLHDWIVR